MERYGGYWFTNSRMPDKASRTLRSASFTGMARSMIGGNAGDADCGLPALERGRYRRHLQRQPRSAQRYVYLARAFWAT